MISQGRSAVVLAIGETIAVNWTLGAFLLGQHLQAGSNEVEAEPTYARSMFDNRVATKIGNFGQIGTAIEIIYFVIAVGSDLWD